MFDGGSPYKGKVTAYDYAIYIADAAVYLMATKPELGITNPYALDETQFEAAVELLKAQQPDAHRQVLGHRPASRSTSSRSGDMVVGTTWQYQVRTSSRARRRRAGRGDQAQGRHHRLVRHLDDLVEAKHPNCMYKWMDYIICPRPTRMATV